MARVNRLLPRAAALAALAMLSGCVDPAKRSDILSENFGDATAANKAIHIADPWPRDSFDTRVRGDGARGAAAAAAYRTGAGTAPAAPRPATATAQ